ncbi:MAG: GAF domain-containing protein, partial [Kofleriaceae bacterium]|nr:GAF domain-containing protein [Kofleriaceae bacterium]
MLEAVLAGTSDVTSERFRHLVTAVRRVIACDAVALLRLEAGTLVPVVVDGLRGEAVARRFVPSEQPRLARILAATGPIRFDDPALPDPFDGLLAERGDELSRPHACMGCPLIVDGAVIGVMTLD